MYMQDAASKIEVLKELAYYVPRVCVCVCVAIGMQLLLLTLLILVFILLLLPPLSFVLVPLRSWEECAVCPISAFLCVAVRVE